MSDANRDSVRRHIDEVFNRGEVDVVDEVFAEDFLYHQPDGSEMAGREALKQMVGKFREALPDLRCTIEDQFSEGDRVVTRWSLRGTHKGDMMGIAPTGKEISIWGTVIHRFENGQIAEAWDAYDFLSLMKQVGAA